MYVTDAERDRIVRELREHYAADALTPEEFDTRVSEALRAVSRNELTALVEPDERSEIAFPILPRAIHPADRERVESRLSPDEWIEWAGHPAPVLRMMPVDLVLIPFGLFWTGLSCLVIGKAIAHGEPAPAFTQLPFLLVGLYAAIGHLIHRAHRRRRTTYAVTNHRVMSLVAGRRSETVEARYIRSLSSVSTRTDSPHRGSVAFDNPAGLPGWRTEKGLEMFEGNSKQPEGLCFLDIQDAPAVAALVEHLQALERG
jgi:hypothetical protein